MRLTSSHGMLRGSVFLADVKLLPAAALVPAAAADAADADAAGLNRT